jgi:hypothetical protein
MARGGARNGAGRKPVHDEINARELCKSAIINKFGSLEAGLKALLESNEPTLQKFVYEHRVFEADAAHIIAKGKLGSDDPRNGIALSKSVHWAFDKGVFTISDQFEVQIHPKAQDAVSQHFPLLDARGRQIILPSDSAYHPHSDALEWHRKEIFGRFVA